KFVWSSLKLIWATVPAGIELGMEDAAYEAIEKQLGFGLACVDSATAAAEAGATWAAQGAESIKLPHGNKIRLDGGELRTLQVWLKQKAPSYGNLIRVPDRYGNFLWIHDSFRSEY